MAPLSILLELDTLLHLCDSRDGTENAHRRQPILNDRSVEIRMLEAGVVRPTLHHV